MDLTYSNISIPLVFESNLIGQNIINKNDDSILTAITHNNILYEYSLVDKKLLFKGEILPTENKAKKSFFIKIVTSSLFLDNCFIIGMVDGSIYFYELFHNEGEINYKLTLTLMGHQFQIVKFLFVKEANYLISIDIQNSVRIWDIKENNCICKLSLDFMIYFKTYHEDIKKNKSINLLSKQNDLIQIKLQTPLQINLKNFDITINCLSIGKSNIYVSTNRDSIVMLDDYFKKLQEFTFYGSHEIEEMNQWNKFWIFYNSSGVIHIVNILEGSNLIFNLFKVKVANDCIINSSFLDQHLFVAFRKSNSIYKVDLNEGLRLFYERTRMNEEENISIAYNKYLIAKGNKKKKGNRAKSGTKSNKSKPSTATARSVSAVSRQTNKTQSKPGTAQSSSSRVDRTQNPATKPKSGFSKNKDIAKEKQNKAKSKEKPAKSKEANRPQKSKSKEKTNKLKK